VNLVYIPYPYTIEEDLLYAALDYIYSKTPQSAFYLEMLAPLIIGSEQAVQWFQKSNRLVEVVDSLERQIIESKPIDGTMWFLNTLSRLPALIESLVEQLIRIYGIVVSSTESSSLPLFTSFVSNVIQQHEPSQRTLVSRLINDIKT
jgi:hypothetical protein